MVAVAHANLPVVARPSRVLYHLPNEHLAAQRVQLLRVPLQRQPVTGEIYTHTPLPPHHSEYTGLCTGIYTGIYRNIQGQTAGIEGEVYRLAAAPWQASTTRGRRRLRRHGARHCPTAQCHLHTHTHTHTHTQTVTCTVLHTMSKSSKDLTGLPALAQFAN